MIKRTDIQEIYKQKFGKATIQVSAPGRANIIGEHTDYNDGYVLPFAINKSIYFTAGLAKEMHFRIYSFNLDKEITIYPDQQWTKGFARYFSSVIQIMETHGYQISGLNIVFGGDLPIGGGISSSSSITCGFIAMLDKQFDLGLSKDDMVSLAVEAEHGMGVEGGNMDQHSIIHGQSKNAILMDCLKSTSTLIELDLEHSTFCLFDTKVSHNLVETEYNTRSRTCKTAISKLKSTYESVNSFRGVAEEHLEVLSETERKRVSHVIAENQRVLDTVEAFANKNMKLVGELLNSSHESLKTLYEVSCPELDFLQEELIKYNEVYGARMMGGGFGGSVIALLNYESLKDISINLEQAYKEKFGLVLEVYPIKPETGLVVSTL